MPFDPNTIAALPYLYNGGAETAKGIAEGLIILLLVVFAVTAVTTLCIADSYDTKSQNIALLIVTGIVSIVIVLLTAGYALFIFPPKYTNATVSLMPLKSTDKYVQFVDSNHHTYIVKKESYIRGTMDGGDRYIGFESLLTPGQFRLFKVRALQPYALDPTPLTTAPLVININTDADYWADVIAIDSEEPFLDGSPPPDPTATSIADQSGMAITPASLSAQDSASEFSLSVGQPRAVSVSATTLGFLLDPHSIIWTVSDPKVVAITPQGTTALLTGIGPGSVTLMATNISSKKSITLLVVVKDYGPAAQAPAPTKE